MNIVVDLMKATLLYGKVPNLSALRLDGSYKRVQITYKMDASL